MGKVTRREVLKMIGLGAVGVAVTASGVMGGVTDKSERRTTMTDTQQALQKALDGLTRKHKGIRNALVAVATGDGRFRWAGAAGDAADGVPMTVDTPVATASTTKLYTAVVIMRLFEQGRLRLDDPMCAYLPAAMIEGLHIFDGTDYTKTIEIQHLLSHTSGLPDYFSDKPKGGASFYDEVVAGTATERTPEDTIARAKTLPPHFAPGAKASYSDTNFQLLGFIIEAVTGKALHTVYREMLFEPLGMTHSYMLTRPDPNDAQMPDFAHFYDGDDDITHREGLQTAWADGGLVATAADELAFMDALTGGRIFERPETLDRMHHWRRLAQRSMPFSYGYGTMKLELPWFLVMPVPEMWGHFGITAHALLHCEELDYHVVAVTNQTESMQQLVMFLIRVAQIMGKLG